MLDAGDPTESGVEFFAVDGWRIVFLRRRDHDPVARRVHLGTFVAGELVRGPDGNDALVPANLRPWIEAP